MISIFHLLWLIPLASSVGFFVAAMCAMSEEGSFENEQKKNDDRNKG